MPATSLSADQETLLAQDERGSGVIRITESPQFNRSPRLCRLLLYLAEQTLAGRSDLLTESCIAVRVFDRNTDFDPDVDTIVRSHMVRLRQKLDQYAAENTAESRFRVSVPKGEYRVRFEQIIPAAAPATLLVSSAPATPANEHNHRLVWLCGALCIAVILLIATLVAVLARPSRQAAAINSLPEHPLWSHFFATRPGNSQSNTLIAADSGLVLLHRMTGKNTTLQEYLTRDFSRETRDLSPERLDEVLNLGERRYTSFVDLNIYRHLQQLATERGGRLDVRYARDIQMNELKQGNVILSGSRGADPWLALYEPQMNFIGTDEWTHHGYIFRNRQPQAGEESAYSTSEQDPTQRVLGVLAYLPNVEGSGNTLIIEGNSMAGTEAISDFVFDDAALLPFLSRLRTKDGMVPYFEVLIEANSVNGSAGPFRILAYRTHS